MESHVRTIVAHVNKCSEPGFIAEKQQQYSYAFRKLYANNKRCDDIAFTEFIMEKYHLTDIEYRSLKSDVATKISKTQTNKSNQEEKIVDIAEDIKELQDEEFSKQNTRSKFKKHKKIKQLEDSLPRDITFGDKKELRELSKLHNNIHVLNKIENQSEREKKLADNKLKIEEKTALIKKNRILHFYLLGEANQKGNRFFNFDFANHKLIYKPYSGKKIEFNYSLEGRQQDDLLKLQQLINEKEIAVTLHVSTDQICIAFDDEIFSGYCIDKKARRKAVKKVKDKKLPEEKETLEIRKVYKKFHDEFLEDKLKDKIKNRYISIDKNPEYIGYCIADKLGNGLFKIIEKGTIDLRKLNEKLGLPSEHPDVIKQNNSRIFEIDNALKSLFEIAKHYKVAYFIEENMDGIGKNDPFYSREANRKIKNIWHRVRTEWQIQKRCTALGMKWIPINPVYTSFIGNLMYNYFDATNAAIEICRRGMHKFESGQFYPPLTGSIFDAMSRLFESQKIQLKARDAQIFKDGECSWACLFKIAKNNGLRWRWDWESVIVPSTVFRDTTKSKVNIVKYIN